MAVDGKIVTVRVRTGLILRVPKIIGTPNGASAMPVETVSAVTAAAMVSAAASAVAITASAAGASAPRERYVRFRWHLRRCAWRNGKS
jgi:hypothetical protein